MTTSIKATADGLSAIIQVGGADKVTVGANGIAAGSYAPQSITPNDLAQKLTLGTSVASTSGTAIDFTGIPSWAKRITVVFNGVSTNGASNIQVQIGSGSVTTSGYSSAGWNNSVGVNTATSGFVTGWANASNVVTGQMTLTHLGSNTWVSTSTTFSAATSGAGSSAGSVTLGGALDRVRITTVNGTDTFDAGSINIIYE